MKDLVANVMSDLNRNLKADLNAEQSKKVEAAIKANLPAKTYNLAVVFLGAVTILLAVGSILLPIFELVVTDALWGALGAGIGGLAGIFMNRE